MKYWNGNFITSKTTANQGGFYNLHAQAIYQKALAWPRVLSVLEGGLAGKFFAGTWRSVIASGTIGTIPLTTQDNSPTNFPSGSNGIPSGYNAGVNVWNEIDFGNNIADSYGFIAIGYFKPNETGTHQFYTTSDDGSGVWIGANALEGATRNTANAVVNNGMGTGHASQTRSGTIDLTANVFYAIRIVFEEGGGGDNMKLEWQGPSSSRTDDLSNYFFYAVNNNTPTGDFE